MKILMISNNYYPYTGGVARSIDVTMKLLKSAGHDIKLITYDFTGDGIQEPDILRAHCPFRFIYRGKIIPISWGARRFINKHVASFKPDIIHLHHPFLLGIAALCIARQYNIPVVFTHHTLYENYIHYLPFGQYIAHKILPHYMRWFYKQLNGIIAPSQAVMRKIKVLTNKQCQIIPSSIDPIYKQNTISKNFDKNRPIQLMTASRLVPEKNIETLLKACSLLSIPFQLKIYGDGYIRSCLENRAYEHYRFSKEQVQFMGELNREQLAQAYAQADIFIFASQSETQGLVIGEAMASGTPVIALNGSGVEDALENGGGVLVSDAEEIAKIIHYWYATPELLASYINQAYSQAKFFYPDRCIKNLIEFYKEYTPK